MTTVDLLDQLDLRRAFGHFPTSVVVVIGESADEPLALLIGSFTSVSLEPPLIGFFVGRTSSTWPLLRTARRFSVNLLGGGHAAWCRALSGPAPRRLEGIALSRTAAGTPVLEQAPVWIDCVLEDEVPVGDHDLVVASVVELRVGDADTAPLVFHRGGFNAHAESPRDDEL